MASVPAIDLSFISSGRRPIPGQANGPVGPQHAAGVASQRHTGQNPIVGGQTKPVQGHSHHSAGVTSNNQAPIQKKDDDAIHTRRSGKATIGGAKRQNTATSSSRGGFPAYQEFNTTRGLLSDQLREELQKREVVEQLMMDSLNRHDVCRMTPTPGQDPASFLHPGSRHPRRGGNQSSPQVSSRPVSAVGNAGTIEQIMSKRFSFSARLLAENSRDALRELLGFFFMNDGSLTVYEFREFGRTGAGGRAAATRQSAMPLVTRAVYHHPLGPRAGEPIDCGDVAVGRTLTFEHSCVPGLPETLGRWIQIRVTHVDHDTKRKLITSDLLPRFHEEALAKLHAPQGSGDAERQAAFDTIQSQIRGQIARRGVRTLTNMCRDVKAQNKQGIDREGLSQLLKRYHIELGGGEDDDEDAQLRVVFKAADMDGSGRLSFDEVRRAFFGDMDEYRWIMVRDAWRKLDPSKTGEVSLATVKKFFNARSHPMVQASEISTETALDTFLAACGVKENAVDATIDFKKFENYYHGVSLACPDDQTYIDCVRTTWGI